MTQLYDPASDIYAQFNWWGTTVINSQLTSRLLVIDPPPEGAGGILYEPILTSPPAPPSGQPIAYEPVLANAPPELAIRVVGGGITSGSGAEFALSVSESGSARLSLYDVRGRRVRLLWDGELAAGERGVHWDGADDGGRRVAAGVYFARLDTRRGSARARVIALW